MIVDIISNFNYNTDYICELLTEVDNKIAFVSNRDLKNSQYDLGLEIDVTKYTDLIEVSEILKKILACSSCYSCFKIEDIISMAKNKLNRC